MDRSYKYLWLIPGAIFLNRIVSLLPAYVYFDPFPYHDILDDKGNNIGITLQSYVNAIGIHLGWIILWIREVLSRHNHYKIFKLFLIVEVFSLIDFLVRYEVYFFDIGFYKIEFTDIKLAMYCLAIISWKRYYTQSEEY